jgi:soluble lytic murein transglycosylase-like protein
MRWQVLVPVAAAMLINGPAAASAAFPHVVAPGESLSSVAATDGLSVEQLAAANGLPAEGGLAAGSTLMIPPQTLGVTRAGEAAAGSGAPASSSEAAAGQTAGSSAEEPDGDSDDAATGEGSGAAPASSTGSNAGSYVVQPGDTLSAIAARAGTSVAELAATNGIDPNAPLLSGTALRLSGSSAGATQPGASAPEASQAASAQPVGATAEGSPGAPPYPTAESVTPSEVGSIAEANGVPPSLAKAIAYQESGFNNNLTSSADARGVMQILPGTWNWIGENLAGSTPLEPASAASNVRGGVLLLHSLLNSTGGNEGLAAAGYYQGLPSVLQNGEYSSTQQYVGNVRALQQQFGGG